MKLIVGLGNPGKEYNNTRHNIGFRYIDNYAKVNNFVITREKFNGLFWEIIINGEKVIFLKPLSFMNLSGVVVGKYVNYYKIKCSDILVIQDDLDMPLGKIKIKQNGSCGGHNGIRNIIDNLKTENFLRLKVGISKDKKYDTKDYVLGQFTSDENKILSSRDIIINSIIDDFIKNTANDIIMGHYNGVDYENI